LGRGRTSVCYVFLLMGGSCPSLFPLHFLFQVRSECHFSNGTQRIRMLERHFFDRQELLYFDSDRGKFVAVAELGEPEVKRANQDKDVLRSEMADVDRFCRVSYEIVDPFFQARRVQPKVKITPTDNIESSPHNTLLICTVGSFFPAGIEIKWFRNGKEEPKVWTTDLIRNGDWTFHIEVMLETKPERGDVYTCQVEHASFEGPVTVKWEPQSDSARSKMWTGIVGIVLGLVFGATGLALYLKNKKGECGGLWGGGSFLYWKENIYFLQRLFFHPSYSLGQNEKGKAPSCARSVSS
uniref:Ig-like domain-containing protein n=1 Tax=Podarcis muralis TaxID=64176 RepID=A0A670I4A4_PODMU